MDKSRYDQIKLQKAKKKLTILKNFYSHLVVYLIFNLLGLLFYLMYRITDTGKFASMEPDFRDWISWNIILTPILWGIGLFFHWLYVFQKTSKFFRNWEDRQIKRYLDE